jgi:hypothetical protein
MAKRGGLRITTFRFTRLFPRALFQLAVRIAQHQEKIGMGDGIIARKRNVDYISKLSNVT